jgi:hypothetical protein
MFGKVLNVLQGENMERVKTGIKANLPTPELAQLMIAMLDQLMSDCS